MNRKNGEVMKTCSPRISEELLQKVAYIADWEGRSKNREIVHILKRYVKQFKCKSKTVLESRTGTRPNRIL